MRFGILLVTVAFMSVSSCNVTTEQNADALSGAVPGNPNDVNIRRTFYPDGKVHKEIVYNNGTKSGLSKEYYKNGQVFQEVNYVANRREGIARRYFDTGVLNQETPYKNDLTHGIQRKYRRSGKLMAEIPYFEGHQCVGIVEYTADGVAKKRYPEIEITPIDNVRRDNNYILEIKMSDDSKGVQFYIGPLVDGKYIKEELNTIWDMKNGVARIFFTIPKGESRREDVHIIAKVKTAQSNYYITEKVFRLAVDHR